MAETQLKLESSHSAVALITGKSIPSKDYAEITISMTVLCVRCALRHHRDEDDHAAAAATDDDDDDDDDHTAAAPLNDDDVELVVSFMRDMKESLKKVWIEFPRDWLLFRSDNNPVIDTATRLLQAYDDLLVHAAAKNNNNNNNDNNTELGIIDGDPTKPEIWLVLAQESCKKSLNYLELVGITNGPLNQQAVTALGALSKLRRLALHLTKPHQSQRGFNPYLNSLAAATNLSDSLESISIGGFGEAEKAHAVVAFLRGKQHQVKHIHIRHTPAFLVLIDIAKFQHLETLKLDLFPTNSLLPFFSTLQPVIEKSISSHLKVLHLRFFLVLNHDMAAAFRGGSISGVRESLVQAMNRNKSILRLESFLLEVPHLPSRNKELDKLSDACNRFAAWKKTMRASSSGPNRLPAALLPLAAMAIKTHPGVNPDWASASMLYTYLHSNPGVIGAAVGRKKWDEATETKKRKSEELCSEEHVQQGGTSE